MRFWNRKSANAAWSRVLLLLELTVAATWMPVIRRKFDASALFIYSPAQAFQEQRNAQVFSRKKTFCARRSRRGHLSPDCPRRGIGPQRSLVQPPATTG